MNINFENLSSLSEKEWSNLFQFKQHIATQDINTMLTGEKNITYRYIGELDCPEDCLDIGVPEEMVIEWFTETNSKPNVFKKSDGTFKLCDDWEANALFESDNCIKKPYYDEEEF